VTLDDLTGHWFTTARQRSEHRGRVDLVRTTSPGRLAAMVPQGFRLRAPLDVLGLDDAEHARWAEAFHGGWIDHDPRLVGLPFPCAAADVSSCFPLVAHHLGWWELLCAEGVARRTVTVALRRLCARAATDPRVVLDPAVWRRFGCTLVEVLPEGEPFPVTVEDEQRPEGRSEVVPVVSTERTMWFAWADVVAAAVRSGRAPAIVRAVRYASVGRQRVRRHLPVVPGLTLASDRDPVLALVAHRRRLRARAEAARARGDGAAALASYREAALLRVVVNALVFGNFARFDDRWRRDGRKWVRSEVPGPWTFLPIASSVAAGARLLLAAVDRMVGDRGSVVAYRDTDSSLLLASPAGGTFTINDGTVVRVLSHAVVDEMVALFEALRPEADWPVWKLARGKPAVPLQAVVFGPKRHAEWSGDDVLVHDSDSVEPGSWDATEHGLGGTFVDPPAMRGRVQPVDGYRRWSMTAVRTEVALAVQRARTDGFVPRPEPAWDATEPMPFPAFRRFIVKTPEMAKALPARMGARPGTRYVEGEPAAAMTVGSPIVALDPGGDLAEWRALDWMVKATGEGRRVSTDWRDIDAVQVVTLAAKAAEWSSPTRMEPIERVVIDPALVRHVGRDSPLIDAWEDGLPGDVRKRRVAYSDADRLATVAKWAKALGPRAFARRTGLPLKVAERAALERPISRANASKALRALRVPGSTEDRCACGCGQAVLRGRGAQYVDDTHRQRARVRRQRQRRRGSSTTD
jgi:hypothetical protein